MTPQAIAAFATLVSFAQHGNRVELKLDRGSAELVWTSPSAFHFRRTLNGPLAEAKPERHADPVDFKVDDTPSALHLRSKSLDVAIEKSGALVKVSRPDGTPVMSDLSAPTLAANGVTWDRAAPAGVQFFGLGPLDDTELALRGKVVDSGDFLVSTAGYGEQHVARGHFDFTRPDRYCIQMASMDYFFFSGLTPKAIFEQRNPDNPDPSLIGTAIWARSSWDLLRSQLLKAVHQAMSGPEMKLLLSASDESAPQELQTRIRQLASLSPSGALNPSPFRQQLQSFFDIYEIETRDKHFPLWHPLPFQFPNDPECARHADEFMLGDEMLVAPIYEPGNKRQVYFPPGTWTSLETNREYRGRTTVTIETPALPVFAHKGAIVPLDSEGGIALHYFPDLGGEFFFIEKDLGAYTQVHAAPAADVMRLEIESKKERDYEWVIHHVERPTTVGFEDLQPTWAYENEKKNLLVRVHVKAGEDNVIHISW